MTPPFVRSTWHSLRIIDANSDMVCDADGEAELQHLLKLLNAPAPTLATPEQIDRARGLYANDNVQIDDGAHASVGDDLVWVQAWVQLEGSA